MTKNLLVAILAMDSKGGQGFGDYICAFNKINFAANDNTILESIAA